MTTVDLLGLSKLMSFSEAGCANSDQVYVA